MADFAVGGRSTANRASGATPSTPHTDDGQTRSTGRAGGTPEGPPTVIRDGQTAEGRRSIERENGTAVILTGRGYRVLQNPSRDLVAQARQAAGDMGRPVNLLAERAFPEADERPIGTAPLLAVSLSEKYGFEVTVLADEEGYVEARSDDGIWVWEAGPCVSLGFRMDKSADPARAITNMLTVVRRVLDSGTEDAAFTFNNDLLLFARLSGVLVKHQRVEFWEQNPAADQLIPG